MVYSGDAKQHQAFWDAAWVSLVHLPNYKPIPQFLSRISLGMYRGQTALVLARFRLSRPVRMHALSGRDSLQQRPLGLQCWVLAHRAAGIQAKQ